MGIGDWGLGIGDWAQSPIPNPQTLLENQNFNLNYYKNQKIFTIIKLLVLSNMLK
jgi:hypothetical protein